MGTWPVVDESFVVPDGVVLGGFRLEVLGPRHNAADHAAWMSSIAHIRATPGFDRGWPPPGGMTLAENLADLVSHADRSARRADFAYSVLDDATGDVIGCVYFKPAGPPGTVRVLSWVRADRADQDGPLVEAVTAWLRDDWPFQDVHYRSGQVTLRSVEPGDVEVFFAHQADPEAGSRAGNAAQSRAGFSAHWRDRILGDDTVLVRTVLVDGRTAGYVVAWWQDEQRKVGYWFGREFWGRGTGTRALHLFLGLEPVRPLFADTDIGNTASQRLLERCGFQKTETIRTPMVSYVVYTLVAETG